MDANRLPPLGWPWDALLDAGRRLERAEAAILAAGTAGDLRGRMAAELDRDDAVRDWNAVKDDLALQWLRGLHEALDRYPHAVAVALDALPAAPAVTAALDELEDRVDAAEARTKRTSGETWELANWVARLEGAKNSHTGGAAHGNRGTSQGPGAVTEPPVSGSERQGGRID